ncbi:hypothetical protein ACHAXR_005700 [Thalassiosira sp. AJA248-18]
MAALISLLKLSISTFASLFIVVTAWTVPSRSNSYRDLRYQWHLKSHVDRRYPGGEVIGSQGKIGSYLLHRLNTPIVPIPSKNNTNNLQYPQSLHAAAVPRGVSPGCLSPEDTPIYACIPSSSIVNVWDSTLPHRRKDLVFLCNCIPSRHLTFDSDTDVTVAILHFGVSHSNANNNDNNAKASPRTPTLNNSPQSPPTAIYGKHAMTLGNLLQKDGIAVHIARDKNEVQAAGARKLAWSSLMWLTCHSAGGVGGEPMRVKDVHQFQFNKLQRLVEEILPSLEILASESWSSKKSKSPNNGPTTTSIGSVQDILDYLRSYSLSISNGNVIPSRELALRELAERNGLLLSLKTGEEKDRNSSSYHLDLIHQVAGEELLAQCLATGSEKQRSLLDNSNNRFERIQCTSSDLEFLFRSNNSGPPHPASSNAKTAVIVGAGMVGSSIAYHLSMRGVNVTVMDQRTNLLPPSDGSSSKKHDIDPGTATSSSFAWLNANDKSPLSYKQFNHLGMEVWRRHGILKNIPEWCGSLVRTAREGDGTGYEGSSLKMNPHYLCVGPLNWDEACRLEPGIDWSSSSPGNANDTADKESEIHFYPEEGHVDPVEAVRALRLSARSNGVEFLEGVQISYLVRDENGKVNGLEYTKSHTCDNGDANVLPVLATADVVVISAGANSSNPLLGIDSQHLQLLEQPGVLAYARSKTNSDHGYDSTDEHQVLKRVFVDTIAQAHILRRDDKTIVVGGGQLITGGGEDNSLDTNQSSTPQKTFNEDITAGDTMIKTAVAAISPFELQSSQCELVRVSCANRPMPSDGFPVLGFVDQGLYVAVMHSGITLGPLAGELASYEVWDKITTANDQGCGNGFQILEDFRPSRSRF